MEGRRNGWAYGSPTIPSASSLRLQRASENREEGSVLASNTSSAIPATQTLPRRGGLAARPSGVLTMLAMNWLTIPVAPPGSIGRLVAAADRCLALVVSDVAPAGERL